MSHSEQRNQQYDELANAKQKHPGCKKCEAKKKQHCKWVHMRQKALKFSHQLFITLFIYKTIDDQVLLCLTNTATTKLRAAAGSCK